MTIKLSDKLRFLLVPFLIVTIGFVVAYGFLDWYIFIRTGRVFFRHDDAVEMWIPFTLSWIPVLVWLRPRVGLLHLKYVGPSPYYSISTVTMGFSAMQAHQYLAATTDQLTHLEWSIAILAIGAALWSLMVWWPTINEEAYQQFLRGSTKPDG